MIGRVRAIMKPDPALPRAADGDPAVPLRKVRLVPFKFQGHDGTRRESRLELGRLKAREPCVFKYSFQSLASRWAQSSCDIVDTELPSAG